MVEEAFGNPWIFKEIISGEKNQKTTADIYEMIIKHIKLLLADKGEYTAVREMRKHISYYVKGLENATEIRRKVNTIENIDELINVFK